MSKPTDALLIIPTYNGAACLPRLLDSLSAQTLKVDTILVDSSSTDGTAELARRHGFPVHRITTAEFNHGGTRQMMVERHPEHSIYIFMTQDAYLDDGEAIQRLLAPFENPQIGASFGRQLPHHDATDLAAHARLFNYPAKTHVKGLSDVSYLGIKTAFISNSFAAYRRTALKEAGGFPSHVILSEDMYAAARMLMSNWQIAYVGNANCRHSHNYGLIEELQRYFDTGVFHAREPWIRDQFGGAGGEGLRYVKSELRFLGLKKLHRWPASLLRNALKLTGFKLGLHEKHLPPWVKHRLSMHKRFWQPRD